MFTGIVETTGKIISLEKESGNLIIGIHSSFTKQLKPGQSIAHNGVCLTVEKKFPSKNMYVVSAVKETLAKTNLGSLKKGSSVNLERSLKVGDRLDGHFVQGHVDCTAEIKSIKKEKGSWIFKFEVKSQPACRTGRKSTRLPDGQEVKSLIIKKGSVCINGVSLTVVDVQSTHFSVTIVPHTFLHTNFSSLKKGDEVNIEFDILGKYIQKIIANK